MVLKLSKRWLLVSIRWSVSFSHQRGATRWIIICFKDNSASSASTQRAWQHWESITHYGPAHPWVLALISVTSRSTKTFPVHPEPSGSLPVTSNPCQPAFPGVPCPSSPAQSPFTLRPVHAWVSPVGVGEAFSTLLAWPLSPRVSLCDFQTTLKHCAGEDVLDDDGGGVDEANEDASTEALHQVTQGLWSDGAWGQTGGDVVLELRVTVILQPPPTTSVHLSFRMLRDHFTSENQTEPQNFLLCIL